MNRRWRTKRLSKEQVISRFDHLDGRFSGETQELSPFSVVLNSMVERVPIVHMKRRDYIAALRVPGIRLEQLSWWQSSVFKLIISSSRALRETTGVRVLAVRVLSSPKYAY